MTSSVILSARRSPITPRNGGLSHLSIEELAAPVIEATLLDGQVEPKQVDEIVLSNALGAGGNVARISALKAGLPLAVAGLTIDRQCAGGLDAILLADALVQSGHRDVVLAGGVESYSRRPLRYRTFHDGSPAEQYDQAQFTPWQGRDPEMAEAAASLASALNISKTAQDAWAVESHAKAWSAPTDHILPIDAITKDQFCRRLTERHCQRAPIVSGTISAANMSVAADGAAFVLVCSPQWAAEHQRSGVELLSGATVGNDPTMPGLAPVAAMKQSLDRSNLKPCELDHVEIMEAFAVQAIACLELGGLDETNVNKWGGSLARGHPIGASGAVLAVQLFHQLQRFGGHAMATIASAGGIGTAAVFRAF